MSKHKEQEWHTEPAAIDPSLGVLVDAYEASHEGRKMLASTTGTVRSTDATKSALSDVWGQLIGLGAQVNWPVVLANLWVLISKLRSGASVADVLAWLMGLMPKPA